MGLRPHLKGTTFRGFDIKLMLNAVPVDLTSCEIIATFRLGSKTGCDVKEFTIGNGVTVTDATEGELSLLTNAMINWAVGKWFFEVRVIDTNGVNTSYWADIFEVTQNVPRK